MEKNQNKRVWIRERMEDGLVLTSALSNESGHTLERCTEVRDSKNVLVFENDYVKVYDQFAKEFFEGLVRFAPGSFYIESEDGRHHSRWNDYIMLIMEEKEDTGNIEEGSWLK